MNYTYLSFWHTSCYGGGGDRTRVRKVIQAMDLAASGPIARVIS